MLQSHDKMKCQIPPSSFEEIQHVNAAKSLGPLRCATECLACKFRSLAHHCTFQDHLMQSAEQGFTAVSSCRPTYWCGEKEIKWCVEWAICWTYSCGSAVLLVYLENPSSCALNMSLILLTCLLKSLISACFGFGWRRQQKRHVAAPPPASVRRRMERKRQKLVGRDKGSLTEQQTKGTGTTTIQIRRKHKNEPHDPESRSPRQDQRPPSRAASEFPLRRPRTGTQHDSTWYGIPCSVWPGGFGSARPAVSLPGFWWKLTLSWPNPGRYPPLIPYHLRHAQVPHCPADHHHFSCLQISFP